jgi:hypothetical protein
MDTTTLKQILREELDKFAGEGLNAYSHLTVNETEQTYAVIDFAAINKRWSADTVLIARLVNNIIYIDWDQNFPTLDNALRARGVPESQIVLTYARDYQPA